LPPNCREKFHFGCHCGELAVLSNSILRGPRIICSKFGTICRQIGLARRATPDRPLFAPTPPNALRNCKESDRKQGYRKQG
jgi:hypothetical protein